VYLILSAGLKMLKQTEKSVFNIVIISVTVVSMIALSVLAVSFSTVLYILICGTVGVVVHLLGKLGRGRAK